MRRRRTARGHGLVGPMVTRLEGHGGFSDALTEEGLTGSTRMTGMELSVCCLVTFVVLLLLLIIFVSLINGVDRYFTVSSGFVLTNGGD